MPTVARLPGNIGIRQHFNEHPPPHFHAVQRDEEVLIVIEDLSVYAGRLSPKALAVVRAWAREHRAELALNWQRALANQRLEPIP